VLVTAVIVLALLVFAVVKVLVLAALFAVLFGGTFLPVVDWLEKHHVKRGLAAMIVAILLVLLGAAICLLIAYSVFQQIPEVQAKLDAAWVDIQSSLKSTSVSQSQVDSLKTSVESLAKHAAGGLASSLVGLVGGVATLIFGVFISLNILVWVLIQGRKLAQWASKRMRPVPAPPLFADSRGIAAIRE
jgi:predicted PurR-regulated permease PerM